MQGKTKKPAEKSVAAYDLWQVFSIPMGTVSNKIIC